MLPVLMLVVAPRADAVARGDGAGGGKAIMLMAQTCMLCALGGAFTVRLRILFAVLLAGGIAAMEPALAEEKAPSYTALKIVAPMKIDGVLTSEEWAGVDAARAMVLMDGDATARAWVVHAGRWLVVGIDAGKGAPGPQGSDWGRCDGVQIALSGVGQAGPTWVLRGYPDGKFTWGRAATAGAELEAQPTKGVSYRAKMVDGGGWTAECRIPFQGLGIKSIGRAPVALLLTVRRAAEDRWLTWPPDAGSTLDMRKAGTLDWPEVNTWEESILAFEARDREKAPPKDAILFIGSSSIVGWNVGRFFPDLATINRGFGGSQLADSVHYFDRAVLPYKPKVVVLYAGDNDVASGKTPEVVAADFERFLARVKRDLPGTHLVYLGIKPSPSRWHLQEKFSKANALVREQCEREPAASFLDVCPAMLDEEGAPRPELYLADRLHMTEAGYQIWTTLLRKHLKENTTCLP